MRLTNEIRDRIHNAVVSNLPKVDYLSQLGDLVQAKLVELMPDSVRKALREHPEYFYGHNQMYAGRHRLHRSAADHLRSYFKGMPTEYHNRIYEIKVDDRVLLDTHAGKLHYELSKAVIDSGLYTKHVEQAALLESVSKRLKATLKNSTTTKGLRDSLEPELHYLIPLDPPSVHNLPALSAPVVSDLRALGAQI